MNKNDLSAFCVGLSTNLYDVLRCIDKSARFSIALVLDQEKRLIATITDGDIRRAILAGFNLEASVQDILPMKEMSPHPKPVTAPLGLTPAELQRLMQEQAVRTLVLVNELSQPEDVILFNDLIQKPDLPVQVLIMAGGTGQRLMPLTSESPKPMLAVGDKPLLEHIVRQLKIFGVKKICISTYYKPEVITNYFGDGTAFGVDIEYFREEQPLGTGGVLGLMSSPEKPLLIINGDILTRVDFRSMLERHQKSNAMLTLAVRQYGFQVPYGVVSCEGEMIQGISEKPKYNFLVNAGIYLIEPEVYRYIPREKAFNMTDLIQWLLDAREKVISFPVVEYWIDIGKHADYEQVQIDFQEGIFRNELEP